MNNVELTATLKGGTIQDLVGQAREFAERFGTSETSTTSAPTTKKARKAKPVEDETDSLMTDDETVEIETASADTDELGFDDEPAPKAKKAKAPKITVKEVNAAAIAHAKQFGRPKTAALLLKKFKVKSLVELDPDQYADVIEALEV